MFGSILSVFLLDASRTPPTKLWQPKCLPILINVPWGQNCPGWKHHLRIKSQFLTLADRLQMPTSSPTTFLSPTSSATWTCSLIFKYSKYVSPQDLCMDSFLHPVAGSASLFRFSVFTFFRLSLFLVQLITCLTPGFVFPITCCY